ncbi:hypothetical protein B0T21DRAFT_294308 [Apiosordaria backusii]|uniref:Uncharacterized protein n=1 Tax=Apiosordaria backusii TaxID=314023 RepID=A0AA40E5Y7_9PEZI|nr:hypothetical protein B0T21DRAFT_294308 [Apiosordaria backusii]
MASFHHGNNGTVDCIEYDAHPNRIAVVIRDNLPQLQCTLFSFDSKVTGRPWMISTLSQQPVSASRRPRVYILGLPLISAQACDFISAIPKEYLTWLSVTGPGSFVTLNMLKQRLEQTHSLETLHLRNFAGRAFEFKGNERLPPLRELVLDKYDWRHSSEETVDHWDFSQLKVLMLFSVKNLQSLFNAISQVPHSLETVVFDMKWGPEVIPSLQALCECPCLHTVVIRLPLKLPPTDTDLLQQLRIPLKEVHDNLAYDLAAGIFYFLLRKESGSATLQDIYVLFGEWEMWENPGMHPGHYFKYMGRSDKGIHLQDLNMFDMQAYLAEMARMAEEATTLDDAEEKKAQESLHEMYSLRHHTLWSEPLDRISLSF